MDINYQCSGSHYGYTGITRFVLQASVDPSLANENGDIHTARGEDLDTYSRYKH